MNKLIEYTPSIELEKYIDAYWSFRNNTGNEIIFPVVPDGCSDIIFHLNDSILLNELDGVFVSGVMENAKLTKIPKGMELFGVRFRPGVLSYFLDFDMGKIRNDMMELSKINQDFSKKFVIDTCEKDENIILEVENFLNLIFDEKQIEENLMRVIKEIITNPQILIEDLAEKHGFSIKTLQRIFFKRVGLTPKKFARIMRFQIAHQKISKDGLKDLVFSALSAGYFDQAHFNKEYQKLVGCNPSHETMSILYNPQE